MRLLKQADPFETSRRETPDYDSPLKPSRYDNVAPCIRMYDPWWYFPLHSRSSSVSSPLNRSEVDLKAFVEPEAICRLRESYVFALQQRKLECTSGP